jgi:hypothetical protein
VHQFHEEFRFRPGDQRAAIHLQPQPPEFGLSENVLERLLLSPAPDERTQPVQFRGGQGTFELQVQLHPAAADDVPQQEFSIEAGGGHALGGEELRGALDDFEDRQHVSRSPQREAARSPPP